MSEARYRFRAIGSGFDHFSEIANSWPRIITAHDARAIGQILIALHSAPPASPDLRGFLPRALCDACSYLYRFPLVITLRQASTTLNRLGQPGHGLNSRFRERLGVRFLAIKRTLAYLLSPVRSLLTREKFPVIFRPCFGRVATTSRHRGLFKDYGGGGVGHFRRNSLYFSLLLGIRA